MKSQYNLYRYGVMASIGLGLFLVTTPASAKVQGQCAECHTMHNSQNGSPMAFNADGTPDATPNEVLLLRGCVACHTGTNDGTNVIPYVNKTTAPTYGTDGTTGETLAGGNFYWVAADGGNDSATGHNVATDALSGQDTNLTNPLMPPGATTALTAQLRCAGVNGCHGDTAATSDFEAIRGSHHADDATIDGTTVATSYRFLLGTVGLEDSDWEYQPSSTEHNQYKGFDRSSDATADIDDSTISALCARCHNDFHNGSGNVGGINPTTGAFASPWVRHPTDFDMSNTAAGSEYKEYGGTANTYQVGAPVASDDVSSVLSSVNVDTTGSDNAIVTCISCHRAHGTPYADLLRWDYSTVEAGAGSTGACFTCHTTK